MSSMNLCHVSKNSPRSLNNLSKSVRYHFRSSSKQHKVRENLRALARLAYHCQFTHPYQKGRVLILNCNWSVPCEHLCGPFYDRSRSFLFRCTHCKTLHVHPDVQADDLYPCNYLVNHRTYRKKQYDSDAVNAPRLP